MYRRLLPLAAVVTLPGEAKPVVVDDTAYLAFADRAAAAAAPLRAAVIARSRPAGGAA